MLDLGLRLIFTEDGEFYPDPELDLDRLPDPEPD